MKKIEYKVMINIWNGARGITSDDYTEEYDGVTYFDEAKAREVLQKARQETKNDLSVNFCYLDKIEVYV